MNPRRRAWLAGLVATMAARGQAQPAGTPATPAEDEDRIAPNHALHFPRDHGAHPGSRIEWWYATGWLRAPGSAMPALGWQLTFFRSRTGLGGTPPALSAASVAAGRFVPRQLLFAHAAVTDLAAGRHVHAQRLARWSGDAAWPEAHALREDTGLAIGPWQLRREAASGRYTARLPAPEAGFTLALTLAPTQPLLLQGGAGFSRKGPLPAQASHYYTQPQLVATAQLQQGGTTRTLAGTGWLDHEWSDELMPPEAVGWDWIGINLHDGGALTAFVLRRRDGTAVWAGGSHRVPGTPLRVFGANEVRFTPQRWWTSPGSGGRYPVRWTVATPAGECTLEALLDAQELDSRASTGAVYWEGLATLRDAGGRELGLGYLEMTGRAAPLKLG